MIPKGAVERPLRVVVLSSTRFGHFCVTEGILRARNVVLAGIITTPPEISISYSPHPVRIATHMAFDEPANAAGCEIAVISGKISSNSYLDPIARWKPDLLLALGWYYLVPKSVRAAVPRGCAGIHASLLPRYRGGAPIPWAIINGESETGVSFFYLEDGVDEGDIIAQERIPILGDDTCATVYAHAEAASARLLRTNLPLMAQGEAPRVAQDEAEATYFPQRKPEDGRIDWSWSTQRIQNFIRAQTKPYPGAFTTWEDRRLTIWSARPMDVRDPAISCGEVAPIEDRLCVGCGDGLIELLTIHVEGMGEIDGPTFRRRIARTIPVLGAEVPV